MKKLFFLISVLCISFTSCSKRKNSLIPQGVGVISQKTFYTLSQYSEYELIIRELEKNPEYKNILFLSSPKTLEYLTLLKKEEGRFPTQKKYIEFRAEDGSLVTSSLKIIPIQHSQSFLPIAEWKSIISYIDSEDEDRTVRKEVKVFYNQSLKMGYLEQIIDSEPVLSEIEPSFDYEIHNGFQEIIEN